jgi:tetratricopeptide (TPR) repeat protein
VKTQIRRQAVKRCIGVIAGWLVLGTSFAAAQTPDTDISRLYLSGAQRLYEQDNRQGARELLQIALEFNNANADALYLTGEIARESQAETERALSALRRALEAGRFERYSAYTARVALIEVLLRTDRVDEAARELVQLPRSNPRGSVAQHQLLQARIDAARGDRAAAAERAQRMLQRYPEDARFLDLLLSVRSSVGLHETRLLRRYREDALNGAYADHYRAAVIWLMRKAADGEVVREWGERYISMGGTDPLASVLMVESGAEPAGELERFLETGGAEEQWLVRRMVAALSGAGSDEAAALRQRLAGYTGVLEDDRDRNGYYERQYRFSNGALRAIVVDRNENGVPEREVQLGENGRVTEGVVANGNRVHYADYPEVGAVEFGSTVYRLIPGRLELPLFAGALQPGSAGDGPIQPLDQMPSLGDPQVLTEELVQPRAFLRERPLSQPDRNRAVSGAEAEMDPDAEGQVVERMVDGIVAERAVDRNGDGTIDYWVELEQGSPLRAIRDIDVDGFFEATEFYTAGALTAIIVDSDDDGRPDYRRDLQEDPRRQWDSNQDGSFETVRRDGAVSELREQLAVTPGIDDIVRIWSGEQRQE